MGRQLCGDAAQPGPANGAQAAGADHDQVDALALDDVQDLLGGVPFDHDRFAVHEDVGQLPTPDGQPVVLFPAVLVLREYGDVAFWAVLLFLVVPLTMGWQVPQSSASLYFLGATLGVAGASFAVVLPLASRWYPAERQGLVMGIAAAGNSGTVIANLLAPRLANVVGWPNVFGLAMLPLAAVLAGFALMARDSPRAASRYRRS